MADTPAGAVWFEAVLEFPLADMFAAGSVVRGPRYAGHVNLSLAPSNILPETRAWMALAAW